MKLSWGCIEIDRVQEIEFSVKYQRRKFNLDCICRDIGQAKLFENLIKKSYRTYTTDDTCLKNQICIFPCIFNFCGRTYTLKNWLLDLDNASESHFCVKKTFEIQYFYHFAPKIVEKTTQKPSIDPSKISQSTGNNSLHETKKGKIICQNNIS